MDVFHSGERQAQSHVNAEERMALIGRKVIRTFMPDQHRELFEKLPIIFIGSDDNKHQAWTSVLYGEPGFITSPTATRLKIDFKLNPHDPLSKHFKPSKNIGLLGLEFETRRRNRMNGKIVHCTTQDQLTSLEIDVIQSYGNCAKYIKTRTRLPKRFHSKPTLAKSNFNYFDKNISELIGSFDTFFICSSYVGNNSVNGGFDVSHRGVDRGAVQIESDNKLLIPDYKGNNFFNTIGNILKNPAVGLLFVDFKKGLHLHLTGTAKILWGDTPWPNIERAICFELTTGVLVKNYCPWVFEPNENSDFIKI